jgi:hypothetical protein
MRLAGTSTQVTVTVPTQSHLEGRRETVVNTRSVTVVTNMEAAAA